MIAMGLFLVLVIVYCIWQKQELNKFEITEYHVSSKKINHPFNMVVISDLHSFSYGKENERLLLAIQNQRPDLGDADRRSERGAGRTHL